jgi:hypothetical protein
MSPIPKNITSQKIIVKIGENNNVFQCTHCSKTIATSTLFIIDCKKHKKLKIIQNNGKTYLKCGCGVIYEVIKCSSRQILEGFKFKESIIVEDN